VRISASELRSLAGRFARPRRVVNAAFAQSAGVQRSPTRRGIVMGALLLALLAFLHLKAADPTLQRFAYVVAELAGARVVDARWDTLVAHAGSAGSTRGPLQTDDAARVQRALEAAAATAETAALRTTVADLQKAYAEKAELLARFVRAAEDSRAALAAAVRADAAVTMLVRNAWQSFPHRERLIAAENLAVRVIAEAQQYTHAPSASSRASLEAYASDLPNAHALPEPLQTGLARLESDVHQLLLLKPLEQTLKDRLAALATSQRLDRLADTYQAAFANALERSDRYRIALVIYSVGLAVAFAYLALRAVRTRASVRSSP
jgi:hypothetical protein